MVQSWMHPGWILFHPQGMARSLQLSTFPYSCRSLYLPECQPSCPSLPWFWICSTLRNEKMRHLWTQSLTSQARTQANSKQDPAATTFSLLSSTSALRTQVYMLNPVRWQLSAAIAGVLILMVIQTLSTSATKEIMAAIFTSCHSMLNTSTKACMKYNQQSLQQLGKY